MSSIIRLFGIVVAIVGILLIAVGVTLDLSGMIEMWLILIGIIMSPSGLMIVCLCYASPESKIKALFDLFFSSR